MLDQPSAVAVDPVSPSAATAVTGPPFAVFVMSVVPPRGPTGVSGFPDSDTKLFAAGAMAADGPVGILVSPQPTAIMATKKTATIRFAVALLLICPPRENGAAVRPPTPKAIRNRPQTPFQRVDFSEMWEKSGKIDSPWARSVNHHERSESFMQTGSFGDSAMIWARAQEIYSLRPNSSDQSRAAAEADCILDVTNHQLRRGSTPIHLFPRTFEVLVYLVRHRDSLVLREALHEGVWQDSFEEDSVLNGCISELRQALGDDLRQPRFILTVPKRGYRFIGRTESLAPPIASRAIGPANPSGRPRSLILMDAIDAKLLNRSLSNENRAQLLLDKADLLQRRGDTQVASSILAQVQAVGLKRGSPLEDDFLICRGKLISQGVYDAHGLAQYVAGLGRRHWAKGSAALAPLLWRLAIGLAPADRSGISEPRSGGNLRSLVFHWT